MDKRQLMMQVRRKKLGLLITDARIATQRSSDACAAVMGIDPAEYESIERGEESPSLPQVESLACFLNVPLQHFWGKESRSAAGNWEPDNIHRRLAARNNSIGELLRQARESTGCSVQEAADTAGLSPGALEEYESGARAVPVPVLETLCALYRFEINDLFDQDSFIKDWRMEKEALQVFQELPEHMRDFIGKPVNFAYIELAMRLSEMPAEKLRTIAESLLEITL